MGLINKVVPAADLEVEARRWAAVLAAKSPVAVQNAKSAFYVAADLNYDKAFAYMNEAFARLCATEDAKEGVAAFLEKRQPTWPPNRGEC
jgi:enoyl-CoA hydratase/carnithine racemase